MAIIITIIILIHIAEMVITLRTLLTDPFVFIGAPKGGSTFMKLILIPFYFVFITIRYHFKKDK